MVYTLIDHRNDVIKCSKLNWNTSCRRVVSLQSGATVLQEHRTLLPSPLQSRWLSWMSWAGVIVPMMVRPLLVLRCSTFLARYVFINTCRKSLVFFNILKWSSNSDGISCRTCVPICVVVYLTWEISVGGIRELVSVCFYQHSNRTVLFTDARLFSLSLFYFRDVPCLYEGLWISHLHQTRTTPRDR